MVARKPGPGPQTPYAKRLERVRTRLNFPSLRQFYDSLRAGDPSPELGSGIGEVGPGFPSYAAARTYHTSVDPPVGYLARVAEVYGVRLEWLINGEGEMTTWEQDKREHPEVWESARRHVEADRKFAELFPLIKQVSQIVTFNLRMDLPARRAAVIRGDAPHVTGDTTIWDRAVDDIARALTAPIEHLRPALLTGEETIPDQAAENYVLAMTHAFFNILPYLPLAPWQDALGQEAVEEDTGGKAGETAAD